MARKIAKWKSRNPMRERGHERARGSHPSSRASSALPVCGARQPLAGGDFLHLFVVDGAGVLVAIALLACLAHGWPADFANLAPMGRTVFLLLGDSHVPLLGSADAHRGSGQAVVAFA